MTRAHTLAIAALVVGMLLVLYQVSVAGFSPGFLLLLGALCIADGLVRLMLIVASPEP